MMKRLRRTWTVREIESDVDEEDSSSQKEENVDEV
jgi:hypothetical protein